jgi:hypothetical protein
MTAMTTMTEARQMGTSAVIAGQNCYDRCYDRAGLRWTGHSSGHSKTRQKAPETFYLFNGLLPRS